jgi:hypothetical protein
LQAQTNSISVGLSSDWLDVPSSFAANQMILTVDPAADCVFYRLVYP